MQRAVALLIQILRERHPFPFYYSVFYCLPFRGLEVFGQWENVSVTLLLNAPASTPIHPLPSPLICYLLLVSCLCSDAVSDSRPRPSHGRHDDWEESQHCYTSSFGVWVRIDPRIDTKIKPPLCPLCCLVFWLRGDRFLPLLRRQS